MYNDKKAWEGDVRTHWKRIMQECPKNWRNRLQKGGAFESEYSWELYQNARKSPLRMLILGEQKIRQDKDVLGNFGTTATTPQKANLPNLKSGSVLNDKYWWPFLNDAWLIGGMHGMRPFHMAGEPGDDALWDDGNDRPRVLGREIFLLLTFGYEVVKSPLGTVLQPIYYDRVFKVGLADFHVAIDGTTKQQDFFDAIRPARED